MTYIIPVTVVDDFFPDPMAIREFALKQEWGWDPKHRWPGRRTRMLHELDSDLFNWIIERYLSIFYPSDQIGDWEGRAQFQKITNEYDKAWIHQDLNQVSGVIYLTPDASPESGTTIYMPKTQGHTGVLVDGKYDRPPEDRDAHNALFEESIVVKNRFNRLIAFDAHLWHSAGGFPDEERLTLVIFIERIGCQKYPLQRMISR